MSVSLLYNFNKDAIAKWNESIIRYPNKAFTEKDFKKWIEKTFQLLRLVNLKCIVYIEHPPFLMYAFDEHYKNNPEIVEMGYKYKNIGGFETTVYVNMVMQGEKTKETYNEICRLLLIGVPEMWKEIVDRQLRIEYKYWDGGDVTCYVDVTD